MSTISSIMDICTPVNAGRTTASPSPRWYSPFQRPVREHPTGRSISCGVSDAPTSSLFSAFSPRNSLRRRVFSGARRYRDPPTPSSTSWYYFNCVACLCCCFFSEGVLLLLGFAARSIQDIGRKSDSTPSSSPCTLPEEWEDCRKEIGETCMFEWTKGLKGRLLPPKWRKRLCQQEQHVSLSERWSRLLLLGKRLVFFK